MSRHWGYNKWRCLLTTNSLFGLNECEIIFYSLLGGLVKYFFEYLKWLLSLFWTSLVEHVVLDSFWRARYRKPNRRKIRWKHGHSLQSCSHLMSSLLYIDVKYLDFLLNCVVCILGLRQKLTRCWEISIPAVHFLHLRRWKRRVRGKFFFLTKYSDSVYHRLLNETIRFFLDLQIEIAIWWGPFFACGS